MAKRFTDTDKWKRPWFRSLPLKAKLVWFYVLDNCDHCGVWPADFDLLSFQTGIKVTRQEFETWFMGKVTPFEADKFFLPSFVVFQQGELSPAKNAHRPIITFLEKFGLSLDEVPNPSPPHPDPIRMGPSKGKGISKGKGNCIKGGVGGNDLPRLAQLWNEHCGELSKVTGCSSTRLKSVQARWAECSDEPQWVQVISILAGSVFCNGGNDRNWKADFDFLIKPDTQHKALEGKYADRRPVPTPKVDKKAEEAAWAKEQAEMQAQAEAEARRLGIL